MHSPVNEKDIGRLLFSLHSTRPWNTCVVNNHRISDLFLLLCTHFLKSFLNLLFV